MAGPLGALFGESRRRRNATRKGGRFLEDHRAFAVSVLSFRPSTFG